MTEATKQNPNSELKGLLKSTGVDHNIRSHACSCYKYTEEKKEK